MQHFQTSTLKNSMEGSPIEYLEFLTVPGLSSAIYHLDAGQTDPQQPHEEDEIYFVLKGAALFTSDEKTVSVIEGTVLFVPAKEKHHFHDVVKDLTLLVFLSAN